jgi:hypothetical protein
VTWYRGKAIHLYGRTGIYLSCELRRWMMGVEWCGLMFSIYLGPLEIIILWRLGKEMGFNN